MDPTATFKLRDDIAGQKMDNTSREFLTSNDPTKGYGGALTYVYHPAATGKYIRGLAAVEWVKGSQTVLAFRGSYTNGDFNNIENWCVALSPSARRILHTTRNSSLTSSPTIVCLMSMRKVL
jgi:hypothetical protein